MSVEDPREGPHSLRSSAWRFVLAGGLNTLVTGAMLSVLATFVDPRLAYTLVFAVGVVIAVVTAGRFVFGVPMTRRLVVLYVGMYLAVYLVGLGAVAIGTSNGVPDSWSGLVVLITAPLTFLGGRLLLTGAIRHRSPVERTHT